MARSLIGLLILFSTFPLFSHGEELNAGFVQGIWYGSNVVIANEPTRIYVALRNNTDHDLTGTVRFSDSGNRIGISYVSALPGRIVEAWVDWTPKYGEHTITASLSDIRVYEIGQSPETGEVEDTIAQDTIFVDYDTDKDGIPNKTDDDDDDDTVSDVDEEKRGTDPLTANPIPKDKADTESSQKTQEQSSEKSSEKDSEQTDSSHARSEGLEQYIPNPTIRSVVTRVTDTINDSHTSLDGYRAKRADAIEEYFEPKQSAVTTDNGTSTSDFPATITRSQINQDESFIKSAIDGGKALLRGGYSLILWILANALSHPALLELLLLLCIILFIYRIARRLGRRRKNT